MPLVPISSCVGFVGRVKIESELLELTPQGFLVKRKSPSGQPITAQELAAQQIAGMHPLSSPFQLTHTNSCVKTLCLCCYSTP
jgi:hypothetical protein